MRKWFSLFLLLTILLIPARVQAQSAIGFATLDVNVWPEFDKPTTLVIYNIELAPKTSLPADVTLHLPASVKDVFVVAVGASRETVSNKNVVYKFTPGDQFATVTIKATDLFIEMDYYDPALTKNGNQREYTYEWPGDYPVDTLHFELQTPLKASNLTTDPALTSLGKNTDGFEFSDFKQTSVKAGQKLAFSFKYQRDTDAPSTSFLQVQPSAPLDQAVPGQSTWSTYLPWILGAAGLVLLLIAAGVYWASGTANRTMVKTRKRHSLRKEDEGETVGDAAHCSQCGKRAQPDDRFCRVCGSRIRRGEA